MYRRAERRILALSAAGGVTDPVSECVSDLAGGVLLEEVDAGDGDLALVGPGSAEFSRCAGQAGPRVGVDEQLGNGVCGHPAAVAGDYFGHGSGFAVDRDLARRGKGWPAVVPGAGKGAPVLVEDLGRKRA